MDIEIANKNIKKDTDHPLEINFQVDSSITTSTKNSLSSSCSASSQESVLTKKEVFESPDRSPQELVFPDLKDPPISSPLDFSPQFTPILQSPRNQASTPQPSSTGYDPNRIPASIFSKPSTPMEWSVASNESLFSLHTGNTSFSKDQFLMMYKSSDLNDFNFASSATLPRLSTVNSGEIKRVNFETNLKGNKEEMPETKTMIKREHKKESFGTTYRLDEAYKSTRSFQFPVLTGHEGGKLRLPNMDSRCQRGQQIFQPQSVMNMMHHHEQPHRPKCGITNWLVCFSCCCRP